jgi:hypothetical protein
MLAYRLEHWILHELREHRSYRKTHSTLSFWRLIIVSFDAKTRRWDGGVECYPVEQFLLALSQGEFD